MHYFKDAIDPVAWRHICLSSSVNVFVKLHKIEGLWCDDGWFSRSPTDCLCTSASKFRNSLCAMHCIEKAVANRWFHETFLRVGWRLVCILHPFAIVNYKDRVRGVCVVIDHSVCGVCSYSWYFYIRRRLILFVRFLLFTEKSSSYIWKCSHRICNWTLLFSCSCQRIITLDRPTTVRRAQNYSVYIIIAIIFYISVI